MQKIAPIKNASGGFQGYLWEVSTPDGRTELVHACDNYTAADACGYKFSEVNVRPMKVVADG